jgi:phospholipase/lecithinase/hemolysin
MDLSEAPAVGTYEEEMEKLDALVQDANQLQQRLAQVQQEIVFRQGTAKALEP